MKFNIKNYGWGDLFSVVLSSSDDWVNIETRANLFSIYRADAIAIAKHFKLTPKELATEELTTRIK